MEVFLLIMWYSVLVLAGLSLFGAGLVALGIWLVDDSGDQHAH